MKWIYHNFSAANTVILTPPIPSFPIVMFPGVLTLIRETGTLCTLLRETETLCTLLKETGT
jgi:hypothetical protein